MTVVPGAAWRPVQNHGGRMSRHLGLVLHVQAGNGGLSGWFNNPAAQASSTWWVSKGGVLEQYVDAEVCAWAQAQGNGTYNSVETEGFPDEPLTPQQEQTLARLYQWGHVQYAWPYALADTPGQPGFGWHGMGGSAWGGHTGCPGNLRKDRRAAILSTAGHPVTPAPRPPSPPPQAAPTGVPVLHVDYFGRSHNAQHNDVLVWQLRMRQRGWTILCDSDFGPQSEAVCRGFQAEKHLIADGLVGPKTWAAAWLEKVT